MKNISDIQQFQQFDNLELLAKQVVEGFITGLHQSPFHGFSVEFAEHRIYNAGESTRHIDWRLYARTEKLFVKRYEEETNLRSFIVLDTSSSMLFPYQAKQPNKLKFSVYCAAALIYLLRHQRDAVGLATFAEVVDLQTRSRLSSVHSKRLYAELERLLTPEAQPLQRGTDTAKALHQIAESIHKRSLVIIFSDMLAGDNSGELFAALQHLRYNKHEVIVFHVTDRKHENQFEFQNRPYKFIDLETGEELRLTPNDLRDDYTQAIARYFGQLKLKCGQYQIDFVEADTNDDFANVLLQYLIKRKKLY